MRFRVLLAPALIACAAIATQRAQAADLMPHPALGVERTAPAAVDPNTFIVGHPASPRVRGGHANDEHPALAQRSARSLVKAIDPNTFRVLPPASVQ